MSSCASDVCIKKQLIFFELYTLLSNLHFIRQSFKGYHCECGIAIFALEGLWKLCLQSLQRKHSVKSLILILVKL